MRLATYYLRRAQTYRLCAKRSRTHSARTRSACRTRDAFGLAPEAPIAAFDRDATVTQRGVAAWNESLPRMRTPARHPHVVPLQLDVDRNLTKVRIVLGVASKPARLNRLCVSDCGRGPTERQPIPREVMAAMAAIRHRDGRTP